MNEYLLGIDIGTSACKVAVFDRNGQALAAVSRDYPVYYPRPGWAEQNPEEWWEAVCSAIRQVWETGGILPGEIAGIGIDGQSWSAIPVDKDGNVMANTPIWMDTRAQEICEKMNRRVGETTLFSLCGNSLQPSYTTGKILWYREHRPEVFQNMRWILQSNSFIAWKLTGEITQDYSQGYGLHCFDIRRKRWDREMCRELEIPEKVLPPLVSSDAIVGTVTREAALRTGILEGTPVTAGGLDAACAALGAGVIRPGETQEQGGQAGGMSICMDACRADPRLILGCHVVPGRWLLQGGTTGGGGVMRWFEREFAGLERARAKELGKSSLEQLNELAEKVPAGCQGLVFLPYMAGERSPLWDPEAKGVFYGLDFSKTRGHMARACMEGVAFSLKHNLDVAKEAGADVSVLRSMGGSANSLLWTQIKADVTGKQILVPSSDTATTLGAVLLAGTAVGMYRDYSQAVACTVKETRFHQPDPSLSEIYRKNYRIYLELYQAWKPIMDNGRVRI